MNRTALQVVAVFAAACVPLAALAQDAPPAVPSDRTAYSPYPARDYPNRVLFGDTHVHTKFSPDAGMAGTTISPEQAYRFAKGERVTSSTGIPVRLGRPLDWLVVADHAENLGLPVAIEEEDASLMANEWGREMAALFAEGTQDSARAAIDRYQQVLNALDDPLKETSFGRTSWIRIIDAAEKHNTPGSFTAFIGFEWTTAPDGNNLHRNVIFRDGKARAGTIIPISAYDTEDPEDLWNWMEQYERDTGGRLLALAHNGNLSNGQMFDDVTMSGTPLTAEYARRRMRFEPMYEVTQTKGDGEAHPFLSPDDEFADFETWDKGSFGPDPKTPDMLPREYAREAYKRGLRYDASLGENPFKFGMVGSTDTHTGLSTAQEDNFFGKIAALEPTADPIRFDEPVIGRLSDDDNKIRAWQANAAGLAAVWSRENTREAIFDAMMRKEVYATTGTRLRVRVFGGWAYDASILDRSDFAHFGYENGVPMGGDLSAAPEGKAPGFLVRALRDPDGANLDRIQVVKGWLDENNELHERVYDVACAGNRRIDGNGRCDDAVGNTVNVPEARYANSIGAPALQAFWEDPDFDREERSFYYVRVLEIPTPRWTAYDARFFGVQLKPEDPGFIQERAYTTPIWYAP
jgi:hypothetical protein